MSGERNAICWVFAAVFVLASASVSGEQRNRPSKAEPYVAPLLPAGPAWTFTLPSLPSAGGAMDDTRVYVPLQNVESVVSDERVVHPGSAAVTALDRETGVVRWTSPIASSLAPLVAGDLLFVAAADEIHALAAASGVPQWSVHLPAPVRAPLLLRGNVLLVLVEKDQLIALRTDSREIAWQREIGPGAPALMNADGRAVYVAAGSRLICVLLSDGSVAWTRELPGTLSEPAVGRDRVFVGSTANSFWALDPATGRDVWRWDSRFFGGDVIGAAVEEDVVYVASLDNMVRALNRGNGNQRWRREAGRPAYPPRAFFGTVAVFGLSPTISTFDGRNGTAIASWSLPKETELQGPPLIDGYLRPFRVAMVVITRDGVVTGLRPTQMLFAEPAAAAMAALPGRPLPLERLSPQLEYLLQNVPPPVPQLTDPFGTFVTLPGTALPVEDVPAIPAGPRPSDQGDGPIPMLPGAPLPIERLLDR